MYIHKFGKDKFGNWLVMRDYVFECQALNAQRIYGGIIEYYEKR